MKLFKILFLTFAFLVLATEGRKRRHGLKHCYPVPEGDEPTPAPSPPPELTPETTPEECEETESTPEPTPETTPEECEPEPTDEQLKKGHCPNCPTGLIKSLTWEEYKAKIVVGTRANAPETGYCTGNRDLRIVSGKGLGKKGEDLPNKCCCEPWNSPFYGRWLPQGETVQFDEPAGSGVEQNAYRGQSTDDKNLAP